MTEKQSTREVAEARFAAKMLRNQEARRAFSDYEADARRIDQNTARLRALRLAKEAADGAAKVKPAAVKQTARRRANSKK